MSDRIYAGTCCACGYHENEDTPCPKREDGTHCVCWWDGPEELDDEPLFTDPAHEED